MQALSDADARGWCSERGFLVDQNFPTKVAPRDPTGRRFRIQIPEEATATVGLGYMLLMSGVRDYVEENFDGAMIWLRRWELWSETIDRVGQLLLEGVTGALGRDRRLSETPALVFTERELVPAHTSLALTMLFQWDACYCPNSGYLFATISHHGHVEVITSPDAFDRELERFSQANPVEV